MLDAESKDRSVMLARHQQEEAQALIAAVGAEFSTITISGADLHEQVTVPADLAQIIHNIVLAMASGDRISVATLPEELTTTVAAKQLGVSRPTLMKMINNDEIASYKVGTHHRLLAVDVEEYKRQRLQRQREAFDKLRELDELLEEY